MNKVKAIDGPIEVQLGYDQSPNVLFICNAEGKIVYANAATERRYGYRQDELMGLPAVALASINMRTHHRENLKVALSEPAHFEWRHRCKDGSEFPVETDTRPVVFCGESCVLAVVRDLTQQQEQAHQLALQAAIMANVADGMGLVSADTGRIVHANAAFEQMLGYGPGELEGRPVEVVNAPTEQSPEETATKIIDSLKRHRVWRGNVKNRRKDGTAIWCNVVVTAFEHAQFGLVWLAVHRDVTEVVQTRIERDQALDNLRRLSIDVQRVMEAERKAIARDIHDDLGSALTGMRLQMEAAADNAAADAVQLRQRLRELALIAAQALEQTRAICSRLRPPMLEDLGLQETLRWFVRDWSAKTGIAATMRFAGLKAPVDGALGSTIFRMTKELLTNVARHAAASQVRVLVSGARDGLRLHVADNGQGFDALAPTSGFGLMGVGERARSHGGQMLIKSGSRGTVVTVRGLARVVT